MPSIEDQSGLEALKTFRTGKKDILLKEGKAEDPTGLSALKRFRQSKVKVNPEADYYKYQLGEMLKKEEARTAPQPTPQSKSVGSIMGVPVETYTGITEQPKPVEPKKPFSVFAPLIELGELEKKTIEAEKKVGYRTIAGPRGMGLVKVPLSGPLHSGIRVGTANLISTLTSPVSLALAGAPIIPALGMLSPALKMAIEAGFTGLMAAGFVFESANAIEAYRSGDKEEFGRAATEAIGSGVFTYLVGKGLVKEGRAWYDRFRNALRNTPRPPGSIEEVGPREPTPPLEPPELMSGTPEVAMERAKVRLVEIEKKQAIQDVRETAEKVAEAKGNVVPEWPPTTPEAQKTAEAKFKAGMPTKVELIEKAKGIVPPRVEPKPLPKPEVEVAEVKPKPSRPGLEKKVMDLIVQGKDNAQIAYKLNIRESEVRSIKGETEAPMAEPEFKTGVEALRAAIAKPVSPKVEIAEPTSIMLTPENMEALEKQFGKDWDELPNETIKDFIEGKAVAAAKPVEEPLTDIEKYYGKPADQITEEEWEKFLDLEEVKGIAEPIIDIDLQTGTPEPPALVGEESIFRIAKEVTDIRTKDYEKNKSIAANVDDALNQLPNRPLKDIFVTEQKLLNDVNRWLDGGEVDIAGTRNFLSEIAARADEFRNMIISYGGGEQDFYDWKETVSEAANWARKIDRPKIERTEGISLYSGIDPFEVARGIKKWYSTLRKMAEEKLPNVAPAEQIANTLRKNVTHDEWKNSKLEELLKPGTRVRKEEVLAQIDRNVPEFKDVILEGIPSSMTEITSRNGGYWITTEAGREIGPFGTWIGPFGTWDEARSLSRTSVPKFSTYQEPGGTNYKELFVTAPSRMEGGKVSRGWEDGHSDYSGIENPIVRLRFNNRVDTQGNKVLFIEEMQPPNPENQAKMPPEFVKRWREIGMKRAIKYAVDGGYDRVAWTTGEMQSNRYSLAKHIDMLRYNQPSGLVVVYKDGVSVTSFKASPPELRDYVGKDIADRLVSAPEEAGIKEIKVDDLDIGGLGLRKVYDQDLPNVAKKLGGKVESVKVPMSRYDITRYTPEEALYTYTRLMQGSEGYARQITEEGAARFGLKQNLIIGTFNPTIEEAFTSAVDAFKVGPFRQLIEGITDVPSFSISPFKTSWHPTLYSGIDPTEATKEVSDLIAAGRRGAQVLMEAEKIQRFKAKQAMKDMREQFNKNWLTQSGNSRRKLELYGREGVGIIQAAALSKGGHPHATNMFRQAEKEVSAGLSRKEKNILAGLIFHERLIEIYKTPSGRRFQYFKEHPIAESISYIEGLGTKNINLVQDLTPEREEVIRSRAKINFEWNKKPVTDAYEGGLIGKEELDELLSHNYQRIKLADPTIAKIFDKKREVMLGGKKRNVYDSGFETLAGGKKTDIFEKDYRLLRLEMYNRLYNRTFINKANKALQTLARKDPGNPFVRVREPDVEELTYQPKTRRGLIDSIEIKRLSAGMSDFELRDKLRKSFKQSKASRLSIEQLAEFESSQELNKFGPTHMGYVKGSAATIPPGWRRHFLYENGARKTIWLEPSFSDEWLSSNPEMTGKLARLVQIATLSPVVKTFATGINPVFALRNLPRDVTHAWFASRVFEDGKWTPVYSTVAPKFISQIGNDYRQIFSDALLRRGSYNDYMEDGGGMDFLVIQGRPFRKGLRLEKPIDRIYDFLGYLNETSEIATRLAIRNRVIKRKAKELGISVEEASKNKEIREEATFAALDQMNFGEGGGHSKALDNGLPYFNARFVGARSFFRSFRPGSGTAKQSWLKLAQFAGIITGMALLNRFCSPKTMEELKNDRRAQRNITIPLGDGLGFEDENGETRYPFLIIPIDQGQQFLKAFFEAATNWWLGDEFDVKAVVQALKDSSPADVSTLPPSMAAIVGYATDTNFWLQEDIWRGTDEAFNYQLPKWLTKREVGGSEEEYTPDKTSKLLTSAGKATGLSPERLKYALEQLFTHDNFYAQLLGGAYEQMFGELPKDQRQETLAEALSKNLLTKSIFKVTNPRSRHGEEIKEGKEEATIKNFVENRGLDALARGYLFKKSVDIKEITAYIDKDPLTGKARETEDYDRLSDRFDFHENTKDLSSRSFWLGLKSITDPQGRAKTYVRILENATPKERKKILDEELQVMDIEASKTPNFKIFTEAFMDEVSRLMSEKVKYPGVKK